MADARTWSEDELQRFAAELLNLALPKDWLWWHTPNEGYRTRAARGIAKAHGMRAGVPDVIIMGPGGRIVMVELKTAKGTLSKAQRIFAAEALELGVTVHVARSPDEIMRVLVEEEGVPLRLTAITAAWGRS